MIKILLRVRFAAMLAAMTPRKKNQPVGSKPSVGMLILMAFLYLYLGVVFLFLFASLFFGLSTVYFGNGMDWAYFTMFVILSFAMIFIGSIFTAKAQIFEAKDNELLLTMPIRPRDILASRMIALLVMNFLMEAVVAIPAFGVWLLFGRLSLSALIAFVCTFLCLPFFGLAVSCLFAWLISLITVRLPKKNLLTVVLFLAFFFAYILLVNNVDEFFLVFAENSSGIAASIAAILPLYWIGSAIGNGNLLHLLFSLLLYMIPFVLTYVILSRSFIHIVTTKRGAGKVQKKKMGILQHQSLSSALLKREFSLLFSSTAYMLNCGLGVPFTLILSVLAIFQKETLFAFFYELELGNAAGSIICAIFAMALCFMNTMALSTAPSLSLEGKRVWVIRSLPISSQDFLRAKLKLQWYIMIPTNLIGGVILAVAYRPSLPVLLLLLLAPALHSVWVANIGLICNLFHVNFEWINEAQVVKQGVNILLTMLFASLPVLVLTVAGIVLAIFSFWLTLLFVCAALGLGVWLSYRYLMRGGARRWETLL